MPEVIADTLKAITMPGVQTRLTPEEEQELLLLLRKKYRLNCIVQYWPLNCAKLFQKFGIGQADVPETDRFYDNMISFPWWSDMPDDLIDDMADRTRQAIAELRC